MKKIYIIIFALGFLAAASGQEKEAPKPNDGSSAKTKATVEKKQQPAEAPKFIDKNGDGINDNKGQQKRQRGKWNSDKFIDNDGDGINDNRCQGLGWGNKGKMKMYGKRNK
jgi:hypothetical protein